MAEESLPQPRALRGTLDESRDVRKHDASGIAFGNAQLGVQRRERIVGDLRMGRGQRPQHRRLAGVRRPDQAHVGDQLEVEENLQLLTFEPWLRVVGSVARRALEVDVASSAGAATRSHHTRAGAIEVGDQRPLGVERDRADGHFEDEVGRAAAGLAPAGAVSARLSVPSPPLCVQGQVADVVGGFEDYRSAAAAVPAVGAASRGVWLTAERSRAFAAMTAAHGDPGGVDEMPAVSSFRRSAGW